MEVIPSEVLQEGISPWKTGSMPSDGFLISLRLLLPREQSWGEVEEFVSGNDWPSKLRIWWSEGHLENVEFNYSPIADPWALMQHFLSLVKAEGFLLVDQHSGYIFRPEEEFLKTHFSQSRAAQFMTDPEGTIIRASRESKIPPKHA